MAVLIAFHSALTAIPGLSDLPAELEGKWPTLRVCDVLVGDPAHLSRFKDAVRGLVRAIKSG